MADHLAIDLGHLEEMSAALGQLSHEFGAAIRTVDDTGWAIGSGQLTDALEDFAGNWRIHRERLLEAIELLQKAAADTASTMRSCDDGLAATFTESAS